MTLIPPRSQDGRAPTPGRAPRGASPTRRWTRLPSPLGPLTLLGGEDGLAGLYLSGQRHAPDIAPDWTRDDAPFAEAAAQLEAYFAGAREDFDLPLDPAGTAFQRAVWRQLSAIPYATTSTYRALAERIGNPRAVRAVGLAVGRNPLCLVVPCHRVIGSDGALTGYAGGLERKRWLLAHEAGARRAVGAAR